MWYFGNDGTPIEDPRGLARGSYTYRGEWRTLLQAQDIAGKATEITGRLWLATDSGDHVSPRYDVIPAPRVGDAVSYAFNGDSYPDGYITRTSPTLKVITTSGRSAWGPHDNVVVEHRYTRRGRSGAWVRGGTWSLVPGHISTTNWEL